jgi:hypothetical protein
MIVRVKIGVLLRILFYTKFEYAEISVMYWETNVGAGVTTGPGFP